MRLGVVSLIRYARRLEAGEHPWWYRLCLALYQWLPLRPILRTLVERVERGNRFSAVLAHHRGVLRQCPYWHLHLQTQVLAGRFSARSHRGTLPQHHPRFANLACGANTRPILPPSIPYS